MTAGERRGPLRVPGLSTPAGWHLRAASGPGPFVTRALFERPDGTVVEWTSRRHRKGLGLRPLERARRRRLVRGATPSSWLLGGLFMIGSFCFAIGSVPAFAESAQASTLAWTFFVGSIFFTSAAYLQYREAIAAPTGPDDEATLPPRFRRWLAFAPHRIDWWAGVIQFVGTLAFNVTTFAGTRTGLSVIEERRWIWAPDVIGSICFLAASWLAFVEARAGERGWRDRGTGWWIAAINLLGSIAFGVAAVGARYLRSTGDLANLALVNGGTFIGAVCFFVGAALLPVESSRDAVEVAPDPT